MTGSPVFNFNSNAMKKDKIQRKLNFVRDVPTKPLILHIENSLAEVDRNSDSQQGEEKIVKPALSRSSLSSFVFDNRRGVKRKLDFDVDDISDEVSSLRFSSHNISLNGFHSRNSSLGGDVKSATISPSKNPCRRSSCTRSSVASTCRRRLFADAEPEPKRAKLESPILCTVPKRKEVKLSLKKRFPGVPNSDAARSGLLLNLAFSKYNMLNNGAEENVSVDFVDQKCTAKSSSKKDLLQYSSIKKNTSSFHYSPVFQAIKKVKRKLNLEDHDSANQTTTEASARLFKSEAPNSAYVSNLQSDKPLSEKVSVFPDAVTRNNDPAVILRKTVDNESVKSIAPSSPPFSKMKFDWFKTSRLRPSLKTEIFNLSKMAQEDRINHSKTLEMDTTSDHPRRSFIQRNSLGFSKARQKCDRIVVNKDKSFADNGNSSKMATDSDHLSGVSKNTESAARRSAKRWFNDSFYKGRRSNLQKSFQRRQEVFLTSHIERFLNDCAQAAELGVPKKESVDDTRTTVGGEAGTNNTQEAYKVDVAYAAEEATNRHETSPVIESKARASSSKLHAKPLERCEMAAAHKLSLQPNNPAATSDFFFVEDSVTSQEISRHCVEEVELFIENVESQSQDGFAGIIREDCLLADDDTCGELKNFSICEITVDDVALNQGSIKEESANSSSQFPGVVDSDLQVEEISSPESVSQEIRFVGAAEINSTPSKDTSASVQDVTFDSTAKRKRKKKKCFSDNLVGRLEKLISREKSDVRMWEYEMSKKAKNSNHQNSEPAVFRVQKMWKEFSRLILQCNLIGQNTSDGFYESSQLKDFSLDVTNSVIIIMETSACPKTFTYSSIFRIHPPWNILSLKKCDCVIILRPCKVEIISKNDESLSARDVTLPNVLNERQFCSCADACNCNLPEGYQTVIQPLLNSNPRLIDFKSCRWRNYNEEYFKCARSISDMVLKHKLFPSEQLFLNLRILYECRKVVRNDCILWHLLCMNNEDEVCCVIMEDEMKVSFPAVDKKIFLRFFGILPWKLIPTKFVPSFMDYIEFHNISEIFERLDGCCLYVFTLSKNSGRMEDST